MQVQNVRELVREINPKDIQAKNIHIAKRFDGRIHTFKNLIIAAKALKDLRSIKFRELKNTQTDKTKFELIEMIMDEE